MRKCWCRSKDPFDLAQIWILQDPSGNYTCHYSELLTHTCTHTHTDFDERSEDYECHPYHRWWPLLWKDIIHHPIKTIVIFTSTLIGNRRFLKPHHKFSLTLSFFFCYFQITVPLDASSWPPSYFWPFVFPLGLRSWQQLLGGLLEIDWLTVKWTDVETVPRGTETRRQRPRSGGTKELHVLWNPIWKYIRNNGNNCTLSWSPAECVAFPSSGSATIPITAWRCIAKTIQ